MKNKPDNLVEIEDGNSIFEHYEEWLSSHKEVGTVEGFQTAATKFRSFVDTQEYSVEEMGERECLDYLNWLDENDSVNSFVARMYAGCIRDMVDYYHTRGYFAYNPFSMALEEFKFSEYNKPEKEKIPIRVIRKAISQTKVPFHLVLVVLLLKTGIRRGEAYNLDLRDIHLDNEIGRGRMPNPRREIRNDADTIFIDSTISRGDFVNGRERSGANKPESTRPIPIDKELKDTLTWWIAMMPPSPNEAEPLLRNYKEAVGTQKGYSSIFNEFRQWAEASGLRGEDSDYHIVPHWCRHWFTTKLRENVDNKEIPVGSTDGYIGGLRGDSADGVLDLYTWDWQEEDWISRVYRNNIPKLFVDEPQGEP